MLLVTIVTGAWATDEVVSIGSQNSGVLTIATNAHSVAGRSGGTNTNTVTAADDEQTATSGGSQLSKTTNIGSDLSSKAHVRFTVAAGEKVRLYYYQTGGSNKSTTFRTSDYTQNSSYYHDATEKTAAAKNTLYYVDFEFATAGTYAISAVDGQTPYMTAVKFTAGDTRPAAPISWSAASASGEVGGSTASLPTLTNESGLTVTYSSSNTSVATIDENSGEVTFVSGGATTISATYTSPNAQATYKTTTVSYTLNIALVAQNNKTWKTSDFVTSFGLTGSASKAITGSEYVSNLEIKGTSTAITVTADGSSQTIDDESVGTGRTKLGKNGTADGNYLHFRVKPYTSITFYGIRSGSGKETDAIAMSFGTFGTDEIKKTFDTSSGKGSLNKIYTGATDIDVYAYSGHSSGASAMEIKVTPLSIGEPTFSAPAGEVAAGSTITITSEYATKIKYKWTTSSETPEDGWSEATATDGEADITVPDYDAVTPANNAKYLHVYGYNGVIADGTKAYRAYTITAADTDAPEFVSSTPANNATGVAIAGTIVLTFNEAIGSVDASKFTLNAGTKGDVTIDGTDNTKVNVAYSALPYFTDVTLSVAAGAVEDASGNASAALSDITFKTAKETLAKPTINAVSYFVGSQTVTISSVEGATITYSLDGENYSAYTTGVEITSDKTIYAKATHENYSDSPVAQFAMYKLEVPTDQQDVSETTTWNFANRTAINSFDGSPVIKLVSEVYEAEGDDQISFVSPNKIVANSHAQVKGFVIKNTIPGKLSFNLANTGNSQNRSIIINGENVQTVTSNSYSNYSDFVIPAGTTVIYCKNNLDANNEAGMFNFKSVTFTAASQDITVGATGFATIGLPFATTVPENVTAYAVESVTGSKVKMSSAIAAGTTIPANQGFVIVAAPDTYTFTATSSATYSGTNLLQAVGATPKAATTEAPIYVFAITDATNKKVGFKKATSGELGAYKAYLPGNVSTLTSLSASFDDATAINGVAEETSDVAPVKVVTANGIQIGKFNVAGARIK